MQVDEIKEVLVIGFYPIDEMKSFVEQMKKEFKLNIRSVTQTPEQHNTQVGCVSFNFCLSSQQFDKIR